MMSDGGRWNSAAAAFCYRTFAADARLAEYAEPFRGRERDALVTHGLALLRAGRPAEARDALRSSLRLGRPCRRHLAGLALAHLPVGLGSRLIHLRDAVTT